MQNDVHFLDGVDTVFVEQPRKAHHLQEYNCRLSPAPQDGVGAQELQHTSVTVRLSVFEGICLI